MQDKKLYGDYLLYKDSLINNPQLTQRFNEIINEKVSSDPINAIKSMKLDKFEFDSLNSFKDWFNSSTYVVDFVNYLQKFNYEQIFTSYIFIEVLYKLNYFNEKINYNLNIYFIYLFIVFFILFFISMFNIIYYRNNLVILLLAIELLLISSNLLILNFSYVNFNILGHIYFLSIVTLAAAESSIVLALIVIIYKWNNKISFKDLRKLKY